MHIGKWLLVRHNGLVMKGIVTRIHGDDLDIRLDNEELINRKFWEVKDVPLKEKK